MHRVAASGVKQGLVMLAELKDLGKVAGCGIVWGYSSGLVFIFDG